MDRGSLLNDAAAPAMGTTLRTLLLFLPLLVATACGGGEPTVLRIPGSIRILEEPWQAWVSVGDDGVRVRLTYDPADGGARERMFSTGGDLPWPAGLKDHREQGKDPGSGPTLSRVATVLELPLDRSWNRTLRMLPSDDVSRQARLFLAIHGEGDRCETIPFLVPYQRVEREIARLGQALQPQDIAKGLTTESVLEVRVTRNDDRVRYRWEQSRIERREPSAPGGDVTLTDAQVRARGRGPVLPGLAGMLEARTVFGNGDRAAVVFLYTTDEVLCIDALRAIECAKADPVVMFFPYPEPWDWDEKDEYRHSIRVPRTPGSLEPESWWEVQGSRRRRVNRLMLGADGSLGWGYWPATPEQVTKELDRFRPDAKRRVKRDSLVVLRFDGRCSWSVARPWVQRVEIGEIEMRLRFMNGDYGIDNETELYLPARKRPPDMDLPLGDTRARLADVPGCIVRLTSPDTATVNDVWRAALVLMDAGAHGIDFE